MDEDDDGPLRPSIVTPLTAIASDFHPSHDHNLQLEPFYPLTPASSTAIIPARTPRFELPQGWEILEVPRSVGNQIDKYYYKTGSGERFRSMKEVERYLSGHEYSPPPSRKTPTPQSKSISKSSSQKKMVVSGGILLKLDKVSDRGKLTIVGSANTTAGTSQFVLPDGWVVEEVPRKDLEHTDKYYYEPGTGQKFRSLVAVERYLSEIDIENAPLSKMFNLGSKRVKKSGSWKRSSKDEINSSASDFSRTHVKINWVLADPGGGSWDAFIGQSIIPEHIRQLWDKKFESSVNSHDL